MAVEKTRADGRWTEARYKGFIRSTLRKAWMVWAPNNQTKRNARIERGVYKCAGYNRNSHGAKASVLVKGKRQNNIFTDHIDPVVDPAEGFTTWDEYIERLFCESTNLQVLCRECHNLKTADEKAIRSKK